MQGPDRAVSMKAVRARWASGVPADFSDPQTTMEFFDRSYQDLKEYLGYYLETDDRRPDGRRSEGRDAAPRREQ